jgi:hypothetical protein
VTGLHIAVKVISFISSPIYILVWSIYVAHIKYGGTYSMPGDSGG